MIRPIDIRLNAAHPELPLAEAVTFTGAPSTVLIRGVPPNCGRWAITAVSVAATFPDGSTTTRAAVQSANGVWVATLPATARSGRTANGLRVLADGIDENGAAVTGYILGVADFAVASLGVTPAPEPGETSWQMLYFDAVPGTLRKGDVAKVDGVLKLYNGEAWEAFATPPTLDDAVTRTSANGVKSSGIWSAIWGALSALPTGFSSLYDWCVAQLAGKVPNARTVNGKALANDVTLTGADIPLNPSTGALDMNSAVDLLTTQVNNAQTTANDAGAAATAANNKIDAHIVNTTIHVTATEKSTWNGKQNALSAQQLANIAAVPNKANDADVVHKAGDETIAGVKTFDGNAVVTGDMTIHGFTKTMGVTLDDVAGGYVGGDSSLDHVIHIKTFADTDLGLPAGDVTIPRANGMVALTSDLLTKLDSTSAAPAFSTSSTYAVGDHVTYNGALYRCTTAVTTAGAWTGSTNWTAEDMTTPDATLDVTATDKLLRLVATNGDVIWGQGYNLSTESSATVLTEHVSAFTFAADAVADQAIVLPSVAAGKVGDFILDVTNLSANDRSLTLTGLDSAFSVVVKAGDDLSETLTVAAGEMARYYFTMTAFRVNSLPTWQVAKEAVENGGAQS